MFGNSPLNTAVRRARLCRVLRVLAALLDHATEHRSAAGFTGHVPVLRFVRRRHRLHRAGADIFLRGVTLLVHDLLNLVAGCLHETPVLHPGGADRLTSAAVQALVHLPREGFVTYIELAFADHLDEVDTPTRAARFIACFDVCRATRQAEATMHTGVDNTFFRGVVVGEAAQQVFERLVRLLNRGEGHLEYPFRVVVVPTIGILYRIRGSVQTRTMRRLTRTHVLLR